MTLTFIAHSAFLVEWESFYALFDYSFKPEYTAPLPPLNKDKPLLVFASHSHEDHYDPKIFSLLEQYPNTRFFLSRSIYLPARKRAWLGISDEVFSRVTMLRPDSLLLTDVNGTELSIRSIKSTDIGNAYLLRAEGKLVYHGGDLGWWHWESEGKGFCSNMAALYRVAIDKLAAAVRDEAADNSLVPELAAAMAPLDPRLGVDYEGLGLAHLLKTVPVRRAFPMHLWRQYDTIDRFLAAHPDLRAQVVRISREGEQFSL